ncbi:hypothetical protein SAMN05444161_8619 [Rhizobiales bacterium GAS191]|nr:hypothetical protein SAMN05444161_8619 [Rhizobiales bacterium GAS191]
MRVSGKALKCLTQAVSAMSVNRHLSFETGDSWVQAGQRMRLYGVQACLRGTSYVNAAGASGDCGEASLAYLAAVIRDLKPRCTPVAQTAAEIVVVCSAELAGSTLDLGTILTTQGYAFAAFGPDNRPVYMPYLVAELVAKKARSGLWAARSFSHPNQMLSHDGILRPAARRGLRTAATGSRLDAVFRQRAACPLSRTRRPS